MSDNNKKTKMILTGAVISVACGVLYYTFKRLMKSDDKVERANKMFAEEYDNVVRPAPPMSIKKSVSWDENKMLKFIHIPMVNESSYSGSESEEESNNENVFLQRDYCSKLRILPNGQKVQECYRFNVSDTTWQPFLKEHGFVVIRNVASEETITECTNSLWHQLEHLGSGLQRNDAATWGDENWPGWLDTGALNSHFFAQGPAAWKLRSLPSVHKIFAQIWNTNDLITSMDVFTCWRPWWLPNIQKPKVERLHVAQSPKFKPGFHCVQGMLVLQDVTAETGGLQIVPNSHDSATQKELARNYGITGDWCVLKRNDPYITEKRGELILAKKGDLILWDSRTIHGDYVGMGDNSQDKNSMNRTPEQFARLAQHICMMPRDKATDENIQKRWAIWFQGLPTTHWANKPTQHRVFSSNGKNIPEDASFAYNPVEITPEIQNLLGTFPQV